MKITKNKIHIGVLAYTLSFILVTGCNDFLTTNDPSHFNVNTYYKNAMQSQKAVNAIYASIYPIFGPQSWVISELRTGVVNTDAIDHAVFNALIPVKQLSNIAQQPDVLNLWATYYRGIANANLAIAHIPDININKQNKGKLLGQAHFLRAFYYFNLVRYFGKVPLIKKPIKGLSSPKVYPKRASLESVYNLIVKDLKFAITSGLPFDSNSGRVTKGAAESLLSTVYLTMAGYPLQGGMKYYKLAMDAAKKVIDSGEYHLFSSYKFLRDPSYDNKGGYIFEIQFNAQNQPNNSLQFGLSMPFDEFISAYSLELGEVFVPKQFIDTYGPDDKRAKPRVFFYNKYTASDDRTDTVHFHHYYVYKYFNKNAVRNTAKSGLNWPVIRYAEVLLNYAESSNEVSGPSPEAYKAINKIRARAGISNLSGLTKQGFRKAVWMERYHEFYLENKIWFLMVRTRKAFNYKTGDFEDYVGHTFFYGETLEKRDLLFPIPANEVRNNHNLSQNPGY